ncbi:hypothetical protein KP003_14625 [Geomonas nitrogeniifigens]|uniref:hypothetical protein n=1 Tax=Geomonas diazotrophica TaxID=2843197 RepID=UPI001C2BC26E|nr:hypothetical protein [Geomonas nitrogeniifigens]QXE85612.1 hypothetical protein KP003_14625 [Geomonas nitrogeniifigens]
MSRLKVGTSSLTVLLMLLGAEAAQADSIHGFLEYNYGGSLYRNTVATGDESRARSEAFAQRYSLGFDRSIFPSLVLSGGGLFQDSAQNGTSDGVRTKTEAWSLSPYLELALKNPFVSSGVGYRRREESSKSNGVSSPKQIYDQYSFNVGLRPSQLPTLDATFTKRYIYDEKRMAQNIETDSYTWGTNFTTKGKIELNYGGSYSKQQDLLLQSQSEGLSNNARIATSGETADRRLTYQVSYNIGNQTSTITSKGNSSATLYISQVGQMQTLVTNPVNPTADLGQLGSFQPLNLVLPQNQLPPAITTQNNIGMSFTNPTDVSTLFIPVTSATQSGTIPRLESLQALENQFSWQVYTSEDGISWSVPAGLVVSVQAGHNPADPGSEQVGFVIKFQQLNLRHIKVVETPVQLSAAAFPTDINSSSIVASSIVSFRTLQASQGRSASSRSTGGVLDLNMRARLWDLPAVTYDFGAIVSHSQVDQQGVSVSLLVMNGISAFQRFNDVWAGTCRVSEEFDQPASGPIRNALSYSVSVVASPLPTLNHSLVYSGRAEFMGGSTTTANSVYLNNSAQLYTGVAVNMSGGYSTATRANGQVSEGVNITFGLDLVPNRNLTLGLSYLDQSGRVTGGGLPDKNSFARTATVNASYRPFETLYVSGSYSLSMENDRDNTTFTNYAVSWSPFRGGDLQFSFAYNEALSSSGNEITRSASPSLTWNIRPGSTLTSAVSRERSSGASSGTTQNTSWSNQLRISF